MFAIRHVTVIVLGIYFVKVRGDGSYGLGQNYSRVFKDMPALFKRIIEMLHENPGVLERNEVMTFYDNTVNQGSQVGPDEGILYKREANFDYNVSDNFGDTGAQHHHMLFTANEDFEGFIGSVGSDVTKLITAEEMVEMMTMVEQKLEEYNNDND